MQTQDNGLLQRIENPIREVLDPYIRGSSEIVSISLDDDLGDAVEEIQSDDVISGLQCAVRLLGHGDPEFIISTNSAHDVLRKLREQHIAPRHAHAVWLGVEDDDLILRFEVQR